MIRGLLALILIILAGLCACGGDPVAPASTDAGADITLVSDAPSAPDTPTGSQDGACNRRSCAQLQAQCGNDDFGQLCGRNGDFGAKGKCPGGGGLRCGGRHRCVGPPPDVLPTPLLFGMTDPLPGGSRANVMFRLPRTGYVRWSATMSSGGADEFSAEIVHESNLAALSIRDCNVEAWAFDRSRPTMIASGDFVPRASQDIEDLPNGVYYLVFSCRGTSERTCTIYYDIQAIF
jgi:hypothetical protein